MKSIIDEIIYHKLRTDGKHSYENPLQENLKNINSVLSVSDFNESVIRAKIISAMTDDLIKLKLSSVFAKIQSERDKVIKKFFRDTAKAPFSPIYWIAKRYRTTGRYLNHDEKYVNSYIEDKITQKNINDYVEQQKNKYKK